MRASKDWLDHNVLWDVLLPVTYLNELDEQFSEDDKFGSFAELLTGVGGGMDTEANLWFHAYECFSMLWNGVPEAVCQHLHSLLLTFLVILPLVFPWYVIFHQYELIIISGFSLLLQRHPDQLPHQQLSTVTQPQVAHFAVGRSIHKHGIMSLLQWPSHFLLLWGILQSSQIWLSALEICPSS